MSNPLESRLRILLVEDWCQEKADEGRFIFDRSRCSHDGTIRFSTQHAKTTFDRIACPTRDGRPDDDTTCYEIKMDDSSLTVDLTVEVSPNAKRHLSKSGSHTNRRARPAREIIMSWPLLSQRYSPNDAIDALERFYETDLPAFEGKLGGKKSETSPTSQESPSSETGGQSTDDPGTLHDQPYAEMLLEGAWERVFSNRFERDRRARERCLAAHGASCSICGFDFGKTYGEQFSGKIEVHHVVPLSTIRKEYVVDPEKDLIPVCPNCHFVFHSKPGGGTYTVEEMRALIGGKRQGCWGSCPP